MQKDLIRNIKPFDNNYTVITTNAIDCLHDSIEILETKEGMLSDDGYTFNNLVNLMGLRQEWQDNEIDEVCQRYECSFNKDDSEVICKDGNVIYFIQCLTAVEAHVLAKKLRWDILNGYN
ncbi:hypothetical protein CYR83_00940 [Ligilactobacillus agilis]|uniref:DUF1828 domain-containing protein n=1 Tax=Ligilactobacillus agilis TaxID=1601 RepID=A0A2I2AAZ5_9LACO|nr:hypothetical protein [Ligilactobacillus agilis]PLA76535.1 hypothetical protein CYR79_05780 [Ligilactobacillus agilis]PLA83963.1 hypothetical protein CYR83_00940 [Ligilactobacillus agilis]